MKRALWSVVRIPLIVISIVALLLPQIGVLFAASLVAAVITVLFAENPAIAAYLHLGWRVYLGVAIFSFPFLTTLSYISCCRGIQSFGRHLRTRGWAGPSIDVVASISWPYTWLVINRNLSRMYGSSFAEAAYNVSYFWFIGWWRKPPPVTRDFGGIQVIEVNDPEQMQQALRDLLGDRPPPEE